MAKNKLIWAQSAKIKLFEILDYYKNRNCSVAYSKKLFKKISKSTSLLLKYPDTGIKTDLENLRALLVDNYIIFYEKATSEILILSIWDTRQNPAKISMKQK